MLNLVSILLGIYHVVTTKISKQKKNSNISNNDNNNNNNNKNKSNNFNINSIDFTKIGHHLFLHSKSAPVDVQLYQKRAPSWEIFMIAGKLLT